MEIFFHTVIRDETRTTSMECPVCGEMTELEIEPGKMKLKCGVNGDFEVDRDVEPILPPEQ